MAVVSYALTTLVQLKAHLDITASTWDTVLEQMIDGATDYIESMCGQRRFKSTTYTAKLFDGSPASDRCIRSIYLPHLPVTAVATVEYNIGTPSNPSWQEFLDDDWIFYEDRGEIRFASDLPVGRQNIRITYTAGYSTIPQDLEQLCIRLASREWNKRKSQGMSNENVGGMSINWQTTLEDFDRDIISKYAAPISV